MEFTKEISALFKQMVQFLANSSISARRSSCTPARIACSGTVATLAAFNNSRVGCVIFNEGTPTLYVKLGTGATTTDYSNAIYTTGTWEVPAAYTGVITGIYSSGTGSVQVTEI